jgi:hypothetical protein
MELAPDFDEFFGSLIARGVEFLVVGAYALAFHGAPRFTGDPDLFVRPATENATRLLAAIQAFGFPTAALQPADVSNPDRIIQLGEEPVQIHIMSAISGVSWEEAAAGSAAARLGSHEVRILGRAEFLKNKRASGRLKDLADIEALGGD